LSKVTRAQQSKEKGGKEREKEKGGTGGRRQKQKVTWKEGGGAIAETKKGETGKRTGGGRRIGIGRGGARNRIVFRRGRSGSTGVGPTPLRSGVSEATSLKGPDFLPIVNIIRERQEVKTGSPGCMWVRTIESG